ncbi:MAG: type II secretion system protein [Candidatus Paceibacterota bacterium]|jgi:type II secretory pathway pseudopilin PulG
MIIPTTKKNMGFTMIELMVSISIFFITASMILTNYPAFGTNLAIENLAQDIALSIRQAQVFGVAIVGAGSGTSQVFNAYGISFPAPDTTLASMYKYTIFADVPVAGTRSGDLAYNQNSSTCGTPVQGDECLTDYLSNSKRYGVLFLCKDYYHTDSAATVAGRIRDCMDSSLNYRLNDLGIVFARPQLEVTKFYGTTVLNPSTPIIDVSDVAIIVGTKDAKNMRAIVVWKTGQISVERSITE